MLTIENIRNIKYKGKVVEVYKKILQVDESGKILCTFENDSHELNENKTDFIWVHKEETIEVKFTDIIEFLSYNFVRDKLWRVLLWNQYLFLVRSFYF